MSSSEKIKTIEKKDVKNTKKVKEIGIFSDSEDEKPIKIIKKNKGVDVKVEKVVLTNNKDNQNDKYHSDEESDEKHAKNKEKKNDRGKQQLFKKERLVVVEKLNKILKIQGNKGFFCFDDLDENNKKEIVELEEDVRKFFVYASWGYFNDSTKGDKAVLSLIKSIYKSVGYNVELCVNHKIIDKERTTRTYTLVEKK